MELKERFEIHGANAARKFLTRHGIAEQQIMTAPGQESVEVSAHPSIESAAHELACRRASQSLLDGVRERKRVERCVPIAELVARVEARDPRRRRKRDGRRNLHLACTLSESREQRLNACGGIVAEYRIDQRVAAVPCTATFAAGCECRRQPLERRFEQADEVYRIAPGFWYSRTSHDQAWSIARRGRGCVVAGRAKRPACRSGRCRCRGRARRPDRRRTS